MMDIRYVAVALKTELPTRAYGGITEHLLPISGVLPRRGFLCFRTDATPEKKAAALRGVSLLSINGAIKHEDN
jgi:hypothetical protein